MSTEFYVVCHERKESFHLGNVGSWHGLDLQKHQEDMDQFAAAVAEMHRRYWGSESKEAFELDRYHGCRLWLWCEQRGWAVELQHDGMDDTTALRAYRNSDLDR